jgi:hypothetical protein
MAVKAMFDGRAWHVLTVEDEAGWFMETTAPPDLLRATVKELVPILKDDLKLGQVRVKYFKPEPPERKAWREQNGGRVPWASFKDAEGLRGQCRGVESEEGIVWLRADLKTFEDIAEVLAHECRHLQDFQRFDRCETETIPDHDEAERQAEAYGKMIRAQAL